MRLIPTALVLCTGNACRSQTAEGSTTILPGKSCAGPVDVPGCIAAQLLAATAWFGWLRPTLAEVSETVVGAHADHA